MNLFEPIYETVPTLLNTLICLGTILVLSVVFSLIYTKCKIMDGYYKDTAISFIVMPVVTCGIVLGVSAIVSNFSGTDTTARFAKGGVALLSALLILKIRSNQRTPEVITYYLFLIGLSMIIGMGYLLYGLILYIFILVIFVLIHVFHFPSISKRKLLLKIKIPEDLNYEHAFDDIFVKYCDAISLKGVKSSDLGTLFVLKYSVLLKKDSSQKEFIDDIRTRNSNLDVSIVNDTFVDQNN